MIMTNRSKREFKYRYWTSDWPGFDKNKIKFRYRQICKALKMKKEEI